MKVGNVWYTEILNCITHSQFPLPALPLLLLPVSIKLIKHKMGTDKAYSNSSYIHWIITAQIQNRDKTCSSF